MKKISILVILLCAFLAGCSFGANTGEAPVDISPSSNTSIDDKAQADVPYILSFESVQEYYEFIAAAKLEEPQLRAFLSNKNYDMNGVQTKEDILQIESMVASVPFPVLKEAELTVFEINTDRNTMFVRYNLSSEETVQFRTLLGDQLTDAELANAFNISDFTPERLSTESMQSLYYMGSNTRTHATSLNYAANAEGYLFTVEAFGLSREKADNVVSSVRFDTIEAARARNNFVSVIEATKESNSKTKLENIPVYLEEELLFGTDGYFFLNRDACFYEGSNGRWNATSALLDAYPTEAIRSRDRDTVYFVYETDTGYRLYLFFSYENDLSTPVGFPVVVGKALSYRDFKDIAVGDRMEEVEAIDSTASLHKKLILEVFDLVPIAAQRFAEQGYPCTTIHYLKDGILKIEYEMQEDRSLLVSNMVFSNDYQIESANGKVVNYRIEDIDLPTN